MGKFMQGKLDLKQILQSKKAVPIIAVIGLIGIFIIFLGDMLPKNKTETPKSTQTTFEDDEYLKNLKLDIEQLVLSITGEEEAQVVITLETGTEYVYATEKNIDTGIKENKQSEGNYNNETSDKTQESYIIINNGTGEQPLIISTISPKIRGVSIVCASGFSEEVCSEIKNAIAILCNISEKKISVSGKYLLKGD